MDNWNEVSVQRRYTGRKFLIEEWGFREEGRRGVTLYPKH